MHQMEEMRNSILTQVLDQSARARRKGIDLFAFYINVTCIKYTFPLVNTLCLGKPEKGKMVENMILSMAQRGQLPGKLGEKELISLLESVNQQTQRKTVVKVS